jgi:predicted nucleic acid-binding protein
MAKYLVDTSILISHLRGDSVATKFLLDESVAVSIITVAELIQGCRNPKELAQVRSLLADLETLYIDYGISNTAAKLVLDLFLSHGLKFLDAIIAATAIQSNLILKTQDAKHFKHIKNLKLA